MILPPRVAMKNLRAGHASGAGGGAGQVEERVWEGAEQENRQHAVAVHPALEDAKEASVADQVGAGHAEAVAGELADGVSKAGRQAHEQRRRDANDGMEHDGTAEDGQVARGGQDDRG